MNNALSEEKVYRRFITFVLITITGVIILNIIAQPKYLPFWPFTANDVLLQLFYLFVVALFLERAVEVIVTVWRGSGEQKLLTYIKILKQPAEKKPEKQMEELAAKTGKNLPRTLAEAERAHDSYSADTGRRAMPVTFVIGLLISTVGVRALQPFVDPAFFQKTLTANQQIFFSTMDVLVTGALLGGGSKGIHQIMELVIKVAEKRKNDIKKMP
jgi:hypothetical protein